MKLIKDEFIDIHKPIYLETANIIISQKGKCTGVDCLHCGIKKQNRIDNKYFCTEGKPSVKLKIMKNFKNMVEKDLKEKKNG